VRHIVLFFEGKKKALMQELARDMKRAAKEERFEDAAQLRRHLFALQHIQDVSLIKNEFRNPDHETVNAQSFRIEAYDVAHLHGEAPIGVMTVVRDGVPDKSQYRVFHIRDAKAGDDAGALREVLSRRFGHVEWQFPRAIVVDGAKAQMNAAEKITREMGVQIPIIGVVKDEHHKARGIAGDPKIIREHEQEIVLANAEAHRFAIGRHKIARARNFLA